MNEITESPEKKKSTLRRKKLWEIKEGYHCSVIGTCLTRSELRKLIRKKTFRMDSGSSDYDIHSALVNRASLRNSQSRALHKLLDGKYQASVNRYTNVDEDEKIEQMWEQDIESGSVAGAYWAIMTHSAINKETRARIYGQIHMKGHDFFGEYQLDQRALERLQNKVKMLQEILGSERQAYLQEKNELKKEITALKKVQQESEIIAEKNEELQKTVKQLQSGLTESSQSNKMAEMSQQLTDIRQHDAGLCGRIDELTSELEDSRDLFRLADGTIAELEEESSSLKAANNEQAQEIVSLETALLMRMTTSCGCAECEDQDTDRCPGPDLCGKTVLYVGGLHKMVPHYKQLVEKYGGRFIHHDGGKEASRAQLPKMLYSADAVLCPVDCVSHDACNRVKKICKRYQKPFVMMRSSGLSSLAKGLTDIVQ